MTKSTFEESVRANKVCHGWSFRNHSELEKECITHYIETGEIMSYFPEAYIKIHTMWFGEIN